MNKVVFDPRDEYFKSPFGAAEQFTRINIRIRPGPDAQASSARMRVRRTRATAPEFYTLVEMKPIPDTASAEFRCEYIPAETGLYWYDFELFTASGTMYIGKNVFGPAEGVPWQLTVYAAGFTMPDWIKGGTMYQIMPDRFARAQNAVDPALIPSDRRIRDDWGGDPEPGNDADYFGGNLQGIAAHLDHLASLGVTALYLNPIFEAHSYHRYNTADYLKIDPLLGDESAFRALCAQARAAGIRIILDGVFSHTGSDSRYFNKYGRYPDPGAYQSADSPYRGWYDFRAWPDDYRCWWGVKSLPEVEEMYAPYLNFITGSGGVVQKWIEAGASGFRLDVADELPSDFIRALRAAARSASGGDALIIGEVWEDASNKESYGEYRPYLNGYELDSVMNYPLRESILVFVTGGPAERLAETVAAILQNYPAQVTHALMNILGTHDTPRALTLLTEACGGDKARGLKLLKIAAALQFLLPGVPCIYYGDEIGMEGGADPINRRCFPRNRVADINSSVDGSLLDWYRLLGAMRADCPALRTGTYEQVCAEGSLFAFFRRDGDSVVFCAVNAGDQPRRLLLHGDYDDGKRTSARASARACTGSCAGENETVIPPLECYIECGL